MRRYRRGADITKLVICHAESSRAAFIEHCFQEATFLIEKYRSVVLAVAEALMDRQTIDGAEIDRIIARALAVESVALER
jgi:ATP-dependent Zn protease